jgi:hypothetical protein
MDTLLAATAPKIPAPLTLMHYPCAPVLRPHVAGYFAVDECADPALATTVSEAAGPDLLMLDLGPRPQAWLCPQDERWNLPLLTGPLFAARLAPGSAQMLLRLLPGTLLGQPLSLEAAMAQAEPHGDVAVQRLLLQMRIAPSIAFRIVALDRYLIARLVQDGESCR